MYGHHQFGDGLEQLANAVGVAAEGGHVAACRRTRRQPAFCLCVPRLKMAAYVCACMPVSHMAIHTPVSLTYTLR